MGTPMIFRVPTIFAGLDTKNIEEVKATGSKFRLVQNMRFDGDYGRKRGGQSMYGGATTRLDANAIKSSYRFYRDDGSKFQIVTSGTNIYKGNDANGAFTSIKSGMTSGLRYSFVTMYDVAGNHKVYMFNGTDTPQQWDGTDPATADVSAAPKDKYVVFHKDHLFTAGSTATPNNLNWCANSNPSDWTTADDAGTMDVGFKITGLGKIADYVVIFGERQIKLLIGYSYDTYRLTEPFASMGTICPYSIANCNGVLFFLTQVAENKYQVAAFDGATARVVSDEVELTLAYSSRLEQVSGVYYGDRYLVAYPSGDDANDRQLVFNVKKGVFESIDVGICASCYTKWDGTGDKGELYAGYSKEGCLYKQDTSDLTDMGPGIVTAAIDAYCETAYYSVEGYEINKAFKDVYVKAGLSTGQTLAVTPKIDDGAVSITAKTLTGSNAAVTAEYRKHAFARTCRNVAVRLGNAVATENMAIYAISFAYERIKLR